MNYLVFGSYLDIELLNIFFFDKFEVEIWRLWKFVSTCVNPHLGLTFLQPMFAKCHNLIRPHVVYGLIAEESSSGIEE